ncbi:MAG: NUDIX hydrolase [archaeon]
MTMTHDIPLDTIRRYVPMITVDGLIIEDKKILLIKRATDPFKGYWALPGGFVELGETLEHAISREILEETGLKTRATRLVGAYSGPDRDPRGHTISIAYLMEIIGGKPGPTQEAKEVRYFDLDNLPKDIAFDHRKMIWDAERLIGGIENNVNNAQS